MKIYTKKGDGGNTSLIGGRRVSKNDPKVNAYGEVDELIAYIGLLKAESTDDKQIVALTRVQSALMTVAALFASDSSSSSVKALDSGEILFLEESIDQITKALPEQKAFILPGAPPLSSKYHIARTVCRRAERAAHATEITELQQSGVKYLNRLSDWLYINARMITNSSGFKEEWWYQ